VFRVGRSDAQELSREFGETCANEPFPSLARFRIIARLSEDGQTGVPFQAATLSPTQVGAGCNEWRFSATFGA